LTVPEIRAAIAAGSTIAIVPTGGTEKNGFHMAMGKHNFHTRAGAAAMAQKLGNALVAPVLQYVPEGQATVATPGVLSCARDCFEPVVSAIARSLKALGFKEVLLVGDNGGNQAPLSAVATLLNKEWEGTGAQAYALTDFYDKGHEYQDAWFLGQFGWDEATVGSHAGIKDTSQLLYVKPEDVRIERIADSFNNKKESGISGDPTKATVEFGRVAIEFKANAAIAQYRTLKARQQPGERQGRRGTR
jgi:creatinine amidohydrolase/Fe(II)-dependent formamide hydrolase-like protein